MPTVTDWIQAASTVVLIAITGYFAYDARRSSKERDTPYLSWQEPHAAHYTDLATTIRLQFDLVLWNIGGAARILKTDARSESGERFTLDHFLESSILPAPNQSVIHIYRDFLLDLAYAGVKRELVIRVTYQDVTTGTEYETRVTVVGAFGDGPPEFVDPSVMAARPIPGIRELGINQTRAYWFLTDHRTPQERQIHTATDHPDQLFWPSVVGLWLLAILTAGAANGDGGLVLFLLSLIAAIAVLLWLLFRARIRSS